MCDIAHSMLFALRTSEITNLQVQSYQPLKAGGTIQQFPSCVGEHDCDDHQNYSVFGQSE